MKNIFEKIKKTLAVALIGSVLFMQVVPSVAAEESTPPQETITTNTNPDQVTSDTDSSNSSTQESEQSTETEESNNTESDNEEEDENLDLDGEEDFDADADEEDNAARAYREQLRAQIEQQVQQDLADQQAQANGDSNTNTTDGSAQVGDTKFKTGDATSTAGILANGNNNYSASPVDSGAGAVGASIINDGNGTNSNNNGSATIVNNNTTGQDNNASVNNNLNQATVTGNNTASNNVGDTTITTGDANTTGTIVTAVNTNVAGAMVSEFNINDDHIGDIVLDFAANCIAGCDGGSLLTQNSGNGSDSDNTADLDITNNNNTFQNNDATIGNDLVLAADSGDNTASANTGGDTKIETGDANVAANVLTFANNNLAGNVVYGVINIFGDLIGDIIFPESELNSTGTCSTCGSDVTAKNVGNGTDSTNTADVNIENNDAVFQNNDADITNNLVFDATTGGNQTNANTGGNSTIDSGDAGVDVNVLNVVNNNLFGGNMWLVIVNEAGNWIGKLIGAPDGQNNFAGSAGTEFNVDQNGVITASNNGNGSESDNTASVSQTNNNNTTQNNKAEIVNNLNLSANTGYNKANDNTGGNSTIKTGDAEIVANLVNFVNNNIVGNGKLFVTVVNVFGSWMGDFVAPGQQKQNHTLNQIANNDQQNTGGPSSNTESNSTEGDEDTGSSSVTNNSSSKKKTTSSGNSDTDTDLNIESNGEGTTTLSSANTNDGSLGSGAKVLSESSFAGENANKTKINLAWLVLLVPFISLGIVGKKLFLKKILPRIH